MPARLFRPVNRRAAAEVGDDDISRLVHGDDRSRDQAEEQGDAANKNNRSSECFHKNSRGFGRGFLFSVVDLKRRNGGFEREFGDDQLATAIAGRVENELGFIRQGRGDGVPIKRPIGEVRRKRAGLIEDRKSVGFGLGAGFAKRSFAFGAVDDRGGATASVLNALQAI